jgi:hypothetical protein
MTRILDSTTAASSIGVLYALPHRRIIPEETIREQQPIFPPEHLPEHLPDSGMSSEAVANIALALGAVLVVVWLAAMTWIFGFLAG